MQRRAARDATVGYVGEETEPDGSTGLHHLVQRVLTELYVRWSKASKADNLDAFVHTMMVRRFIDERRRPWWRRVRLAEQPPEPAAPASEAGPDPADRLDLRAALVRVPPRQRAVLVLRFLHDQTVEETAEALGCSAGTVKSQTHHGLAAMRRLLGVQDRPVRHGMGSTL